MVMMVGVMWAAIARCSVVIVSVLLVGVPRIMTIRRVIVGVTSMQVSMIVTPMDLSVIMTSIIVTVIVTFMGVTMVMTSMRVTVIMTSMRVTVVSMAKCRDPHKVDYEPKCADRQELADALHLAPFDQPLDCFVDNFDADEPNVYESQVLEFPRLSRTSRISRWQIRLRCPLCRSRKENAELAAIYS